MELDSIFGANTQNKISIDATLTSQGFVSQTPAARRVSPKSLNPSNGNLMFLDAVEIEPQTQFSSLEREATRMVRSPKAEILLQIAKPRCLGHTTILS